MDRASTLSIGAIARATGVPVETLRTWERRYGFPLPARVPSGHRRYRPDAIHKLRLMLAAKTIGLSPAETSTMSPAQIASAIAASTEPESTNLGTVDDQLHLIREMRGPQFDAHLVSEWQRKSTPTFFDETLSPLLSAVGEAWSRGEITIAQEHWASQRLRDRLSLRWRPLAAQNSGADFVCAALPGDEHDLALHMIAVIVAENGGNPVFLGSNVPVEGISTTARIRRAKGVFISVSKAYDPATAVVMLDQLSRMMPDDVELLVGGAGAPHVAGVTLLRSWTVLGFRVREGGASDEP